MADMQDIDIPVLCSSSSPPPQPDDISLFLRQILLRSSSPFPDFPPYHPPPPPLAAATATATVASSSSVGNTDNDPDEYDCESEEAGFEAHPRKAPLRNCSKRSRAAEVHNLSEKRRRSKINEKMKALQKLIPNSNKTDKASMLDEAIEYLKQLQLQVQKLTMRNGSSLYPSELMQNNQLSHIKMATFCEVNDSLTNIHPSILHQEQHPINDILTMPNQQGNDHNGLGDSLHHHHQQQLNMIPDFQSVFTLNAKGRSNNKDDGLEAYILRRSDRQDDEIDNSMFLLPHLSGLKRGREDIPKI